MEDTDKKIIKVNITALMPKVKETLIFAICAFLCSYASLPLGISPFGISVCAAKQKNITRYIAVYLGAICGAAVLGRPFLLAAIVFTFPFRLLLEYFIPKRKHRFVAPINAAVSLVLCYTLEYFQYGMLRFDIMSGIIGTLSGIYFSARLKEAMDGLAAKDGNAGIYPLILLVSVCILSISSFNIYGISAGMFFAVLITLFFSEEDGFAGCASALLSGMGALINDSADITAVIALGLGALAYSKAKTQNRIIKILLFNGIFCLFILYTGLNREWLGIMGEGAAAASVYMLIPEKSIKSLRDKMGPGGFEDRIPGIKGLICLRLDSAKKYMERIAKSLKEKQQGDIMDIYAKVNETAEDICRDCRRAPVCWGEEYSATRDVFNKAANRLIKTGNFSPDSLPDYFKSLCLNKDRLYGRLSDLAALCSQNALIKRTSSANSMLIAQQYEGIGAYIKELCDEIAAISSPDRQTDIAVKEYLASLGQLQRNAVYRDSIGALHLDMEIRADGKIYESRIVKELSDILGRDMTAESFENDGGIYKMKLIQKEKYTISIAQVNKNKQGERVCGDSFTAFRSSGYKQLLALADGMGSGENAERLSTLTLDILKNLIENGFAEDKACNLVNSTLLLGGDGQSFSTLDLTSINLFNGRTDFYKLGAAPTLIIRQNKAYEVFSRTLPAGIVEGAAPDHKSCKLKAGDIVIMFSDGVEVTEKMLCVCKSFSNEMPINLCERLIEISTENEKAADDITVAVARLDSKISA